MNFSDLDFELPITDEDAPAKAREHLPIYTMDTETDPFEYGRYPKPFSCGLFDGSKFHSTWGENCIDEMMRIVESLPQGIIYIHNGGRFDIYYYMKYITGFPALIINSRIVRCFTKSASSRPHEIRDSYAIMPFALAKYKKDDIDYKLMEADKRELHKDAILSYLKGDCIYLYDLCIAFVEMFGPKLTVGGTAMKELKKFHSFENLGPLTDESIRSKYYYGGRVECFRRGELRGDWKVYDVNSMYPYVMKNFLHPIEMPEGESKSIKKSTCFITVEGKNYGAFPQRTKQGLRFDIETGVFTVSIHEYETAIRHNLFVPSKIIRCVNFRHRDTFSKFVDTFYELRNKAKSVHDDIHALFYKYVLNSAYGKFAQNSDKYFEYTITDGSADLESDGWIADKIDSIDLQSKNTYIIWKRKPLDEVARMYNVATGASITGAARAVLMDGIARADEPIYCDTDSIVCKGLDTNHNSTELGSWKLEATADTAFIGGKKLYALYENGECVKQANKGVKITGQQIQSVCRGETVISMRDAPSFHLDGSYSFIKRKVRML